MKLRHSLSVLAALFAPTLFAQTETITVEPIRVEIEEQDPDAVFVIAEEMPTFPGGQEAMMKFIGSKIRYPQEAADGVIQGTVYVTFVVERDGSIGEAKVLRGLGGGCSEEALRVVKSMPLWKPGMQGGKLVRTSYNLPIRFKLQDKRQER